jgi:hypothetical protein
LKAQIASTAKELETAENAIKQRAAEDAKKNDPRLVEVGVSFHQGDEVLQMFTQNPLLRLEKFAINGVKRLFATISAIS